MAKTSKKAAQKTAGKTIIKPASFTKNKLTIDLSNVLLTDKEIQKLLNTVQKNANANLKTAQAKKLQRAPVKDALLKVRAATVTTNATITATFFNTIPGRSELTATHNGVSKTITQSDTLSFENVAVNNLIRIKGNSLGRSEITIDRTANPQEREFAPGAFGFHFTIKG